MNLGHLTENSYSLPHHILCISSLEREEALSQTLVPSPFAQRRGEEFCRPKCLPWTWQSQLQMMNTPGTCKALQCLAYAQRCVVFIASGSARPMPASLCHHSSHHHPWCGTAQAGTCCVSEKGDQETLGKRSWCRGALCGPEWAGGKGPVGHGSPHPSS